MKLSVPPQRHRSIIETPVRAAAPQLIGRAFARHGARVRKTPITEVRVDESGRLIVVPASDEDFAFIYRAAMEISWDAFNRNLVSPVPRAGGWTLFDWFRQIRSAVASEYGATLTLEHDTKWLVPPALRRQIEECDADFPPPA